MLIVVTAVALLLSFIADKQKTVKALVKGGKMLLAILPDILIVLLLAATLLGVVPAQTIAAVLGRESGAAGYALAASIGSIAMIPGFVAFPLASILQKNGVTLDILAVFITTLIMVGIITLPVEQKYFGCKVALLRNALSLIGAIIIGLLIGVILT